MNPIRIGCTGVHSGGKSTTSAYIYSNLKVRKYTANLLQEVARDAKRHGFNLDKGSTAEGQGWITDTQMREEMELMDDPAQFMIMDRVAPDAIPYVRLNEKIPFRYRVMIEDMIFLYVGNYPYDLLIYHSPFTAIENDGVRSIDAEWQLAVDKAFRSMLPEIRPLPEIVYLDDMDKRDRRDQAWNYVVQYLKKRGIWKN
jgi:nicotinamide riboside kinase